MRPPATKDGSGRRATGSPSTWIKCARAPALPATVQHPQAMETLSEMSVETGTNCPASPPSGLTLMCSSRACSPEEGVLVA